MKYTMPELSRSQYEEVISEWILSERDRQMMRRRFLDGIAFDQLAEEFNLSVQQTKRIVSCNRELILRHI